MSATLVAKDLSGGHAHRTLFEDLDLTVAPGDVVGVVGANGAGKTTLLRLLAGDVDPARRAPCTTAPPTPSSAGCRRSTSGSPARRSPAYVARRTGAAEATADMEAAAEALGSGAPGRRRRLRRGPRPLAGQRRRRPRRADRAGARRPRPRTSAPDALMTSLSGGQAARAALAALLLSRFDVVLLDEPTNDLDLAGLERLESFVHGPARRRRAGLPRPRVPGPLRHPDRRARPRAEPGRGLRRRLRRLPGGARGRPPARPGGLRRVRRQARPTSSRGPAPSASGAPRASATR